MINLSCSKEWIIFHSSSYCQATKNHIAMGGHWGNPDFLATLGAKKDNFICGFCQCLRTNGELAPQKLQFQTGSLFLIWIHPAKSHFESTASLGQRHGQCDHISPKSQIPEIFHPNRTHRIGEILWVFSLQPHFFLSGNQ